MSLLTRLKTYANGGKVFPADLNALQDQYIAAINAMQPGAWINVTLLNSYTTHFTGLEPAYKIVNGVVYLRGEVTRASPSTGSFFQLPAGARPAMDVHVATPIPLTASGSTPPTMLQIAIASDGNVTPLGNTAALACFFGICFPADL